jgi:hypothetical protein
MYRWEKIVSTGILSSRKSLSMESGGPFLLLGSSKCSMSFFMKKKSTTRSSLAELAHYERTCLQRPLTCKKKVRAKQALHQSKSSSKPWPILAHDWQPNDEKKEHS